MKKIILLLIVLGIFILGGFLLFPQAVSPQVQVNNQSIQEDGSVLIAKVTAIASSWLVVQVETNGVPGEVIGYTKLQKGLNENVRVKIDVTKRTPQLFAMIHEDTGIKGTFDFPANDMPLLSQGDMVSQLFRAN